MRILFLSQDSGGRCQMAEGLARQMFGDEVSCSSAGIEAARLHPLAVETMREINIDIARQASVTIEQVAPDGLDLIVVVSERDVSVGHLPKTLKRMHWPVMDPAFPPAPEAELRQRFRDVRMQLSLHLKGLGRLRKTL